MMPASPTLNEIGRTRVNLEVKLEKLQTQPSKFQNRLNVWISDQIDVEPAEYVVIIHWLNVS